MVVTDLVAQLIWLPGVVTTTNRIPVTTLMWRSSLIRFKLDTSTQQNQIAYSELREKGGRGPVEGSMLTLLSWD